MLTYHAPQPSFSKPTALNFPMRPSLPTGLLFIAALLLLMLPSCLARQTDTRLYELRGKVISTATSQPVSGALLQISGQPARFSDSDGSFAFSDLPPGRVLISALKPGFFNQQQLGGWIVSDPPVEVPSSTPVLVKLTPEAVIFGEVKNADGDPLEGIAVRAERWRMLDGRKQLQMARETTTDDQGKFRIAELPPASYFLAFLPAGNGTMFVHGLSRKVKPQEGYGTQFYPGVADIQSATPLPVRAGSNVHVTHNFAKQPLFQVSGSVRGILPQSSFDVQLTNSLGENAPGNTRFDPGTGDFQIPGIPAGTYLLTAVQFHSQSPPSVIGDPPMTATQTLHVDRDLAGVVLVLGSGISIPVQVREDFSSAPGETHQVYVHLLSQDFAQNSAAVMVPPSRSENIRAPDKLENISPGTFWVEAQPVSAQDYVAELRCGHLDLLRDQLVIAPGASVPSIDVTLRNDVAQLSVALRQKDRPAAILIYSSDYPRSSRLMPFPPGAASLSVSGLPPGSYQVLALAGLGELEFRNPQVMEKYLPHAVAVTLSPHDNAAVTVDVQDSQEQSE